MANRTARSGYTVQVSQFSFDLKVADSRTQFARIHGRETERRSCDVCLQCASTVRERENVLNPNMRLTIHRYDMATYRIAFSAHLKFHPRHETFTVARRLRATTVFGCSVT